MASNGSRKRRHKSKEKPQTSTSTAGTDMSQKQLQKQEQDISQPQQQNQGDQHTRQHHEPMEPSQQHHHHQQQQQLPQPEQPQQLPMSGNVDDTLTNGRPLLACILDRLFLSRASDLPATGNADNDMNRAACLSMAGTTGQPGGIQTLLDEQAGQNSFMLAACSGDAAMMALLWSYRGSTLDINAVDKEGNTALHLCAHAMCKEGVSFLLSNGVGGKAKNNHGQTALHIAAKHGDQENCDLLIKHLSCSEGLANLTTAGEILREDLDGRTPICEALWNQHLTVVKLLMDACSPQEILEFYMRRIQKLSTLNANDQSLDVHPILGSLLLVVKRLQKEYLKEMAAADPIQHLVQVMRLCISSPRVLSTACLLISVFVWKECSEDDPNASEPGGSTDLEDAHSSEVKDSLLQQFLEYGGPDVVIEKMSAHAFTAHDTYIIVSTLLPIMILAGRVDGRTWLEQNSGHLSFYKELLTRNKAFITHINLSNHFGRGLQVGHVIKTFFTFVEEIEAKDREQNLAELLEEEERDRLKRERKKKKRQKKQSKQGKPEAPPTVPVADLSTDDENERRSSWAPGVCGRTTDALPPINSSMTDKEQSQLFYQTKQQLQQHYQVHSKDQYSLLQSARQGGDVIGKAFSSEACMTSDKLPDKEAKWRQPITVLDEFPPISGGCDDRMTSDAGEGWVKVESRKQICKGTCKQNSATLTSRPLKKQELTRPAPMRWADVAKIGCCRDSGARNFTVLLGDVGRCSSSDYYKMSVLSRGSPASTAQVSEQGESRTRALREAEDWQQIARNAFADNMASKQHEDDNEVASPTSASSDSDSEEVSSTTSSECPCGQSSGLQTRKKSLLVVDDFDSADSYLIKDVTATKNDYYTFSASFSGYFDGHKDCKPFPFENADTLESKWKNFDSSSEKGLPSQLDKNFPAHENKLQEISWSSRPEMKPTLTLPDIWDLTSQAKSMEDFDAPESHLLGEQSPLPCDPFIDSKFLTSAAFSRSKTPPVRAAREAMNEAVTNLKLPSVCSPSNAYVDLHQGSSLLKKTNDLDKPMSSFTFPLQKCQAMQMDTCSQWVPVKQPTYPNEIDRSSWLTKDSKTKHVSRASGAAGRCDMLSVDIGNISYEQLAFNSFMPSFASMTSSVDNNHIVTSVVESVLTPAVTTLANLSMSGKLPAYSSSRGKEVPSPPPGFKFKKPNSLRVSGFDPNLTLLGNHATLGVKDQPSSLNADLNIHEGGQQDTSGDHDSPSVADKQHQYGQLRARSPMIGVVGPFSKSTLASEDTAELSQQQQQFIQQQQQRQHQHQLFQSHAGLVFQPPITSSAVAPSAESRSQEAAQGIYGLPVSSSRTLTGLTATTTGSWIDRPRAGVSSGMSPYTASSLSNTAGEFSALLTGRLQQRQTLRRQETQQTPVKRHAQPYPDIQPRTLHDTMDISHRNNSDQTLLQKQQQIRQQQLQQQYCTLSPQKHFQPSMKQNKASSLGMLQPKQQACAMLQHHARPHYQQQLQLSPPVLFPSDLRDEPEPRQSIKANFPAFHDATGSDLLSDLFADPLLVEKFAINQIRQQFLTSQANFLARDAAMNALRDSVYCNDLEYYASLYRVKLKDLLIGPNQSETCSAEGTSADRLCGLMNRADHDKLAMSGLRTPGTIEGRNLSPEREAGPDRCSRRWRDALNKILEIPWTMRRQYGDIVLPNTITEFNISHVEYPLVLGFTSDGCEVAVLILDKSQAYIDPYLLDIMCDPELDHHFILKCKSVAETCSNEYVALDLCDYTLAEYIQIVQLSHHQDPLSANRLAWQILEGLRFIHQNFNMPHGNLKPCWIFVDSEGRLRLGGYGIVTKQPALMTGRHSCTVDRSEIGRAACWTASEDLNNDQAQPSMASDIQVAGMLLYFILTGGQHPFGATPLEAEVNIACNSTQMAHISEEANDLVSGMLFPEAAARPTVEHCLKHPFFWSNEKKFRLILIVGSDVLTEMKTGIALTGNGSPTMMEILSVLDIIEVSPNWVQAINPTVMKEMRSFRVYKNSLSELTLFIYNCCLHFDKMSTMAKEVLDDPCKYFQTLFPSLFMAIFRSLKASDRTDRTCYKPFFS